MQWLIFGIIGAFVALGIRRMSREGMDKSSRFSRNDEKKETLPAQEMMQCSVCHAYVVAKSARHCGRDDCPYPKAGA